MSKNMWSVFRRKRRGVRFSALEWAHLQAARMSPSHVRNQGNRSFSQTISWPIIWKKMWATTPWDIPESKPMDKKRDCVCQRLEVELASRQEVPPPRTLKGFPEIRRCLHTMYIHVCNECAMHQTTYIIYTCICIYIVILHHCKVVKHPPMKCLSIT